MLLFESVVKRFGAETRATTAQTLGAWAARRLRGSQGKQFRRADSLDRNSAALDSGRSMAASHEGTSMNQPLERNKAAWNRLADTGSQFANVATDDELREPLKTLDTRGWLPASVQGLDVLCLAGAGGWQSILYAVAGANVTVVDLSPSMLALDRREAERRQVTVRCVEASMDDLAELDDASFDIVHQPVSTCYVPDIARVARDNATYISQHKQPTSLQIVNRNERNQYCIGIDYYHSGALPPTADTSYREPGAVEYLHRWDQLVGELCRSGFVIEDLREPYRGDPNAPPGHFKHRGRFVAPYVRMKARRQPRTEPAGASPQKQLWTP
jgi:SAM-dependent methyltransferase